MGNNKVIVVNSFKGGCGKTSIALSICISAAMEENNKYNEIYYFDIDVAGTGSYYKLFILKDANPTGANENEPKLLDYDGYKNHKDCINTIILKDSEHEYSFKAICIEPKTRIDIYKYNTGNIRFEPAIKEDNFVGNFVDFIKETILVSKNKEGKNLYVFDCSPGLNRLEHELISKLDLEGIEVKEVFVTSYDNSHIIKTVDCLNEYCFSEEKIRKVNILINDIHNISNISKNSDINFDNIIEKVKESLQRKRVKGKIDDVFKVYKNEYVEQLSHDNLFEYVQIISNSFSAYDIRTRDFYKEVIKGEPNI